MNRTIPELAQAAEAIIAEIQARLAGRARPLLVALDGGSGAGKSSLASLIAERLDAALVQSDDFFAAAITDAGWEGRTPAERAADAIDWRRLRAEALEPLTAGEVARWQSFDFAAGARPDGSYAMGAAVVERQPRAVIVLDGAYSARPELADLVELAILVDVPAAVRHARLAAREDAQFLAAWHLRWDAAEEHYFNIVRPPSAFDLVVTPGRASGASTRF
jgi:uridine kinase